MELDINNLCNALNILVKPADKGEYIEKVGSLCRYEFVTVSFRVIVFCSSFNVLFYDLQSHGTRLAYVIFMCVFDV